MERKRRALKRFGKRENGEVYTKRKITTDTISHYILYPVIHSTIGKSNDFYFHVLRLCWNDRNILKDSRCQDLLRGLHLKEDDFHTLDIHNLGRSVDNKWYASSRKNDLAKIGKVSGYFLRRFACSVGKALDDNFDPEFYSEIGDKDLNELFNELKENKTIVPVIVKLDISLNSEFDASRFVCLTEDVVNILLNGKEIAVPRRVKLLELSSAFHSWAWVLLNSPTPEIRQQLINDIMNENITRAVPLQVSNEHQIGDFLEDSQPCIENQEDIGFPIVSTPAIECATVIEDIKPDKKEIRVCGKVERRLASTRSKQQNTRYPSDEYEMLF